MNRDDIHSAIDSERARQDVMWGRYHDRSHKPFDWAGLLAIYVGRATEDALSGNQALYKRNLVKIAALATAALEFAGQLE